MRGAVLLLICIALTSAAIARGEAWVVAEDGRSPYHIVVAVDATMQDYHAAELLQRYVHQMTGTRLRLVSDDNVLSDAEITVGFNRHTRKLAPHLKRVRYVCKIQRTALTKVLAKVFCGLIERSFGFCRKQ